MRLQRKFQGLEERFKGLFSLEVQYKALGGICMMNRSIYTNLLAEDMSD